jgi:hypothetical protein
VSPTNKNKSVKVNNMPAKSKKQQRFMGMIRSIQTGELDPPTKDMADIAKKMSKEDVLEFAKTKHDKPKKLPVKIKPKKKPKKKKNKKKSIDIISNLIKLANNLDNNLLFKEADLIDQHIQELLLIQ